MSSWSSSLRLCTGACRPCWSSPCGAARLAYSDTGSWRDSGASPRRGASWQPLGSRQGHAGAVRGLGTAPLVLLLAAAQPDRGQALQQRRPPLLRMVLLGKLAAPGANLVLRRNRQLVDARHARSARRHAFRLRRNESLRLMRLRSARRRIDEQRRLWAERTDGHLRPPMFCGRMAAATAALADSIDSLTEAGAIAGAAATGRAGSGRSARSA